jgi:hypothetical protein
MRCVSGSTTLGVVDAHILAVNIMERVWIKALSTRANTSQVMR